jgi:hypothetical protein
MAWNKADLDRSYKTLSPDDKKVIDERVTKSVAQWLDSSKDIPAKSQNCGMAARCNDCPI